MDEKLEDHFVTRREHDLYKEYQQKSLDRIENTVTTLQVQSNETNRSVTRIETVVTQFMESLEKNNKTFEDKIDDVKEVVQKVDERVDVIEIERAKEGSQTQSQQSSKSPEVASADDDDEEKGKVFKFNVTKIAITAISVIGGIITTIITLFK